MKSRPHDLLQQHRALEARFAARVAAGLTASTGQLPHDIAERLRVAREQASARARLFRRLAPAPSALPAGSAGTAVVLGSGPGWRRWGGALLPLAVLLLGLIAIEQWTTFEQIQAAADIDTMLLSDDLPPTAYSDPGFAEYLRSGASR